MITIDLITGFLGSGKTTFIRSYVRYLKKMGENICILENDHGAINVDALLLHDLEDDRCDVEMIVGGDGAQAHRRRFRTKLIALRMLGYTRVVVEPSGIYDLDEFFDTLQEDPLNRWYQIGNVLSLLDVRTDFEMLSQAASYVLASEAAVSGKILLTHADTLTGRNRSSVLNGVDSSDSEKTCKDRVINSLNILLSSIGCDRTVNDCVLMNHLGEWGESYASEILDAGYIPANYEKQPVYEDSFQSFFYMNLSDDAEMLEEKIRKLFSDPACGSVHRVKGFLPLVDGWVKLNAVSGSIETEKIKAGQNVLIVIGEKLNN